MRVMRQLVRDRERLASLSPGGSPERPIEVTSSAVVDGRAQAMCCPQCGGRFALRDHRAPCSGIRAADVVCRRCGTGRTLWFRLGTDAPS